MKSSEKLHKSLINELAELKRENAEIRMKMDAIIEKTRILETCFEHSLSSIAILDRDFNFLRVNQLYAKADKRDVSDFYGHNHFEFYPSNAKDIFEQVIKTKLPYQTFARPFIYAGNPERGVTYWDWTLVPVLDDSKEVEFLIFSLSNVTDRVKAETELKKIEKEMDRLDRLNLLGQMAAGIGHEIRNPMTSIRGFLQLLESKLECKKYQEYFELMINELDRANSIITEFLSLAKNKPVEYQKINLNSIIQSLSPLLMADAMVSNMDINIDLQDIPELVLNEKEIRQLILNLTRNGLEAMSPNKCLTIKTFIAGEEVILSIQDQGHGIKPDILEKIGTPFVTTKEQGTGLGLATCYSIVERHNATIKIDTDCNGTTFFVQFQQ